MQKIQRHLVDFGSKVHGKLHDPVHDVLSWLAIAAVSASSFLIMTTVLAQTEMIDEPFNDRHSQPPLRCSRCRSMALPAFPAFLARLWKILSMAHSRCHFLLSLWAQALLIWVMRNHICSAIICSSRNAAGSDYVWQADVITGRLYAKTIRHRKYESGVRRI